MIQKKKIRKERKKSEDRVLGSGFGLRVGSGMTAQAITLTILKFHSFRGYKRQILKSNSLNS